MKKVICLLIAGFVLLAVSKPISAQESKQEKDFTFTIKTNPLAALGGPFWLVIVPLTGEYKVLFEAKVAPKVSLQFGVGYIGPSALLNLDDLTNEGDSVSGIRTSGFRIQGMFKYFLSRNLDAPEGFYIGPHVSFATAELKSKDDASNYIKAQKLNINGVIGYQLITKGGFALDIYTGIGFVSRNWNFSGSDFDTDQKGFNDKASINIPFGLSFGYAF
jgi:hypothetical protein